MNSETYSLAQLGWRPFYSQQLTLEDLDHAFPARIATVQRGLLVVLAASGAHRVTLPQRLRPEGAMPSLTVGDWVLVLNETSQVVRLLERQSLIMRMAAGTAQAPQSIAVAKDTTVLTLNATDKAPSLASLAPWLEAGQTVAFVGSSGVGKSTLINSLLGVNSQETRGIRDADSKGRHTTTARYFLRAPCGAWLIDTPGMRELKIGAAAMGLHRTFVDIDSLARQCRYRDCSHRDETGCAVRTAVADGRLEARRLENYLKLAREAQRAAIPLWRRHQQSRQGGRLARAAQQRRRRDKGRE